MSTILGINLLSDISEEISLLRLAKGEKRKRVRKKNASENGIIDLGW